MTTQAAFVLIIWALLAWALSYSSSFEEPFFAIHFFGLSPVRGILVFFLEGHIYYRRTYEMEYQKWAATFNITDAEAPIVRSGMVRALASLKTSLRYYTLRWLGMQIIAATVLLAVGLTIRSNAARSAIYLGAALLLELPMKILLHYMYSRGRSKHEIEEPPSDPYSIQIGTTDWMTVNAAPRIATNRL